MEWNLNPAQWPAEDPQLCATWCQGGQSSQVRSHHSGVPPLSSSGRLPEPLWAEVHVLRWHRKADSSHVERCACTWQRLNKCSRLCPQWELSHQEGREASVCHVVCCTHSSQSQSLQWLCGIACMPGKVLRFVLPGVLGGTSPRSNGQPPREPVGMPRLITTV